MFFWEGGFNFLLPILIRFLSKKNIWKIDPDETIIDEVSGWILASFGFYVQFRNGFTVPWLLSILLWPVGLLESTIVWAVNTP